MCNWSYNWFGFWPLEVFILSTHQHNIPGCNEVTTHGQAISDHHAHLTRTSVQNIMQNRKSHCGIYSNLCFPAFKLVQIKRFFLFKKSGLSLFWYSTYLYKFLSNWEQTKCNPQYWIHCILPGFPLYWHIEKYCRHKCLPESRLTQTHKPIRLTI